MKMIKNKYILVEEFNQLIKNIPKKYNNIKKALILIYSEGVMINKAISDSNIGKGKRTA